MFAAMPFLRIAGATVRVLLRRREHEPCQHIDQFSLCSGDGDHFAASAIGLDCTARCRGLRLFLF
jgi:hypothetical protein